MMTRKHFEAIAAIKCVDCGCERETDCYDETLDCDCDKVLSWQEVTDRLDKLHSVRLCRYESYQCSRMLGEYNSRFVTRIPDGESASYGDLHNTDTLTTDSYVLPNALSGSDYSGSTVEVANHRAFEKMIPCDDEGHRLEGFGFHEVYGGHGTFAWAIRIDMLQRYPEILEMLEALQDYPVVDEDELSEYETENQFEQWESWGAHDTEREIEEQFGIDVDDTGERFAELFETVRERANEYWFAETGPDMTIKIDRVVAEMTVDDLVEYGVKFSVEQPSERCTVDDLHEHQIEYDETIGVDGTEYTLSVCYEAQGTQFGVETSHGVGLGTYRDRSAAIKAIRKDQTCANQQQQ